jgi:hypothetical protein
MIRPAELIMPPLRAKFPHVMVVTSVPDVEHRTFPLLVADLSGGKRHPKSPHQLSLRLVELSAHSATDLASAEGLYEDALDVLYDLCREQRVTTVGWLHSVDEMMGATQVPPLFADTWRVLGRIQLGLRPNTKTA